MSTDYIPDQDDAFVHYSNNFNAYASAHTTALGLNSSDLAGIGVVVANVGDAWASKVAAETTLREAVIAFDAARGACEPVLREFAQIIQANPDVLDTDRAGIGITVRKTTRTPVGPIDTNPLLYRVDQESLLHRLWFSDSATPGLNGKPMGAGVCEIREQIVAPGGAAPTNQDAMPFLCLESKLPHRNDFEPPQHGSTAYYALRWVNTRQQPGPWSAISGYPIS